MKQFTVTVAFRVVVANSAVVMSLYRLSQDGLFRSAKRNVAYIVV